MGPLRRRRLPADVYLYILGLVCMPIEQYTDKDSRIKQPCWMHWYSGIVSIMYIYPDDVYLYILGLVGMPIKQHTDKDCLIKQPWRMHGDSGIVSIMQLYPYACLWRRHLRQAWGGERL